MPGDSDSKAGPSSAAGDSTGIDRLIAQVRELIPDNDRVLTDLFDTYAQEARFARMLFDRDIRQLQPGAAILEVGAGMLLLSCQLQREGYRVTALEPFGEGFSHFAQLQQLVKRHAAESGIEPDYIATGAEALDLEQRFDLALSINVMEHVDDVPAVLEKVHRSLKPGRAYRFICPNYRFPYEPHFGIPTFGSKQLTERFMRRRIETNTTLPDPQGLWDSLNWITPGQVRACCRTSLQADVRFDSSILRQYLERVTTDPIFRERHRGLLTSISTAACRLGVFRLFDRLPAILLPVMDVTITRAR